MEEIQAAIADTRKRAEHHSIHRSRNAWANQIIFRLSCCCGLRSIEIRRLRVDDFLLGGHRPAIRIRKEATKGQPHLRRGRLVPLWWDKGTYDDLAKWVTWRRKRRGPKALVMRADWATKPNEIAQAELMPSRKLFKRWRTAIQSLGEQRAGQLGVHCGRHTFCTQSLRAGRSLVEVRDAAGHKSIQMTNNYLHVLNAGNIPDTFDLSFLDEED